MHTSGAWLARDLTQSGAMERRRSYHTSLAACLPDKKANVEKAADTLKEKKKKVVEVATAQEVRVHLQDSPPSPSPIIGFLIRKNLRGN